MKEKTHRNADFGVNSVSAGVGAAMIAEDSPAGWGIVAMAGINLLMQILRTIREKQDQ